MGANSGAKAPVEPVGCLDEARGYLLVSMLGPTLGVALIVTLGLWLVGSSWDSFPPTLQTIIKIVGGLAIATFMGATIRADRRGGGNRRGF